MKKRFILIPLLALLMTSGVVVTPRTFERVVVDAEQNGANYTREDWEKADKMFEHFSDRYDYDRLADMSEEEQREVGRLTARYLKVRARSAMDEVGKSLKAGFSVMRGFMEGFGVRPEILQDEADDKQ